MRPVKIYTAMLCPYCSRAKSLLSDKGVAYEEIDVTFSPGERRKMAERAGRTSVPQIWIGETHIGGSDELHDLERQGKLDALLSG